MGCPELDMTSYFRFVRPDENPHERLESPTEKTSYSRFSHTVVSYYRYYSPELGRWLSREPLEEVGSFNLYSFVYENPIYYYDFLGLNAAHLPGDYEPQPLVGEGGVSGGGGLLDLPMSPGAAVGGISIAAAGAAIIVEEAATDLFNWLLRKIRSRAIPKALPIPKLPKGDLCKCVNRVGPTQETPAKECECDRYQLSCDYEC